MLESWTLLYFEHIVVVLSRWHSGSFELRVIRNIFILTEINMNLPSLLTHKTASLELVHAKVNTGFQPHRGNKFHVTVTTMAGLLILDGS